MTENTSVIRTAMIDTHVLIYACREARKGDDAKTVGLCRASRNLVSGLRRVIVSDVAWTEFLRYMKEDERAFYARIAGRIRHEALDTPIAERAAELLSCARLQETICQKCLNAKKSDPCSACGAKPSKQQRLADAMIAATAEARGMPLYTYDPGIRSFALLNEGVRLRCQLLEPPHPDGPLFEKALAKKKTEASRAARPEAAR